FEPSRVVVLSRVTLGADVAITSVVLDAARRRFPQAELCFAGPRKAWELFERAPGLRHLPVEYPRQGTLAARLAVRAVLEEVLECLLRHGLTRIVVLNGHGGNMEPIREATRAVWQTRRVLIPCLYLWRIAASLLPAIAGPERAKAALGHGADPLTSLALHLLPEAMRPDLLPPPRTGEPPLVLGLPQAGWGLLS
ncbi:MAG: creatininase family protein, partial [Rhodobacteraceae bacterium]|nr:creatininase family protein [Paracoccaceae bacterium]